MLMYKYLLRTLPVIYISLLTACGNTAWIGPGVVKYDTINDLGNGKWYVSVQGGLHSPEQLKEAVRRKALELCGGPSYTIKFRKLDDSRVVATTTTSWSQEFTDIHGMITCEESGTLSVE